MTQARVAAALVLLIAAGCTHRQELAADGSPLEVGQTVTAHTRDGAEVDGVIVKGPLGGYRVRLERSHRELELGELTGLQSESVARGAGDGFVIGFVAGAVLGGVVAIASWDDSDSQSYLVGGLLLATAGGGLVGAAGGAAGQATYEYALPAQR